MKFLAFLTLTALPLAAAELPRTFLEKHCFECHGEKKHKAGVRFDTLKPDFSNRADAEQWLNAMDQINAGEMPPEDKPQPTRAEISAFTGYIADQLKAAEAARHSAGGKVVLRRLNRAEYANTIKDLLGIDFNTAIEFPADERRHGFDRIGASLTISPSHLESYAAAAAKIVDRAIVTGTPPKSQRTLRQGEEYVHEDDKSPEAKERLKKFRYISGLKREGFGYPDVETLADGAMIRSLGISFGHLPASADGEYRVKIRAYGVPFEGITPRMGIQYSKPTENSSSYFAVDVTATADAPQIYEFRLPLKARFVPWANSSRTNIGISNDTRINGGGEWRRRKPEWIARHKEKNPLPDLYAPQVFIDWLEIEGPLNETWPPASHRSVFFKGPGAVEDMSYAREIIEKFLPSSFRRPVTAEDIDPILSLVKQRLDSGEPFVSAIKTGLQAILCSPDFLYLAEDTKRDLTDHQLASRLSYFLWSSMPDDELLRLANAKTLRNPTALTAQVKRMLADPKSERFVDRFGGQWLQLDRVGQFKPDPKLFPAWSDIVQQSAIGETKAFFREVLRHDLSVLSFLDSDWTMLNETMSRFYGIGSIKGDAFQKVALTPEHHRGGVMTHASILSLTGDGTRTRPVHRGVWVMESILAQSPQPPPPDVPEIEPNVPGSARLSVRERLAKHSSLESCAACHAKIDPLGFAFENYNAIGQWRVAETEDVALASLKNTAVPPPPPVSAAGVLPRGRKFANAAEFKKILLDDREKFFRALTEKMFIYALGRELELSDREDVNKLRDSLKKQPTLANLITRVVLSEPFRTK